VFIANALAKCAAQDFHEKERGESNGSRSEACEEEVAGLQIESEWLESGKRWRCARAE
jgi:hypothetical protein